MLFLSSCGLERPDDSSNLPRLGLKVETLSLLGLRVAFDREARGRQEKTFGQPERHQGGRKGLIGQLAKGEGGRKGSIGQPARHQGGTREIRRTGLPIESRFWKGAGFCITSNTISMANGSARGKSWGGLHGWLPVAQTGL